MWQQYPHRNWHHWHPGKKWDDHHDGDWNWKKDNHDGDWKGNNDWPKKKKWDHD